MVTLRPARPATERTTQGPPCSSENRPCPSERPGQGPACGTGRRAAAPCGRSSLLLAPRTSALVDQLKLTAQEKVQDSISVCPSVRQGPLNTSTEAGTLRAKGRLDQVGLLLGKALPLWAWRRVPRLGAVRGSAGTWGVSRVTAHWPGPLVAGSLAVEGMEGGAPGRTQEHQAPPARGPGSIPVSPHASVSPWCRRISLFFEV